MIFMKQLLRMIRYNRILSFEMYDYDEIFKLAMFVITPLIIVLFIYIARKKLCSLFSWLLKMILKYQGNSSCQQKDIIDVIKDTDLKMASNWMDMNKLLHEIQNSQSYFVNCLQNHIESTVSNEKLGRNIIDSLDESLINNEQLEKIRQTIEAMHKDILSMKISLQTFKSSKNVADGESKRCFCIDNFTQTEYEIKKRVRDGHRKISNESETLKLINIVKKCLADVMKETKLQIFIDQEEENRELQVILEKLGGDRDDIKKTIIQAFSIAAEQAKSNFDQCGQIGQDAMNYIAVLHENSNKMLKIKLEKTDNRLKEILNAVDGKKIDFDAIKEVLEKINGRFDEIFKSVELAGEIEKLTRKLSKDTKQIQEMQQELVISLDCLKPQNCKQNIGSSEIMQYDSITSATIEDLQILSKKQKSMMLTFSMVESCWENMTCMNNRVEKGCQNLCNLIEGLEHNLNYLNESVGILDQVIRCVNLENLCSGLKCHSEYSEEIIQGMLKSTVGNAGDGDPQISKDLRDKLLKETSMKNVRLAMDKEVTIIELILKKVCEKINSKTEDVMHSVNVNEELQNCYRENDSGNFKDLKQQGSTSVL